MSEVNSLKTFESSDFRDLRMCGSLGFSLRCASIIDDTSRGVASLRSADTNNRFLGRGDTRQIPFGRVNECLFDSSEGNIDSTRGEFRHESSTSNESEFLVVSRYLKRLGTRG
jgi:hypothetical protein